ncbi:MAG: hypothetical protein UX89_C0002G0050 [Parcubacteria group bacterium GW2011_GWA2_47_16]|nr:MAG: hypothetical protein UX89_C0002G0050 [Parcubacteria group bacterium GW2011_GWA2_47_16]
MPDNQKIVISLGGSLIIPDELDLDFLRSFKTLIEAEVKTGKFFIIITGGGKVCRRYQEVARELGAGDSESLDWVGIYATRLNATLLRAVFGADAYGEIVVDPTQTPSVAIPIIVGGGGVPGHSSDFAAVLMAEKTGAKRIVNLSNVDYVYDKDPRKFPDAEKVERVSWTEFLTIVGDEHRPGINVPFDPMAAKLAKKLGLEVAIMNGKPLLNLQNYLEGKAFKGTVISS